MRQRYLDDGLEAALYDRPRSGRPTKYGDKAEAELVALACSDPPEGYSQWSLVLLTAVARQQSQLLSSVSQETVRQTLKKNAVSLGYVVHWHHHSSILPADVQSARPLSTALQPG